MWDLDHKEGWAPKNWCFWTVVLEESWESLGMQGKQTSQSWRKSPWIFIGRTDVEAVAPILWPPDMKIWLIGKDPDAGKDWGQEEKQATEEKWWDGIIDTMDMNLSKLQDIVKDKEAWNAAVYKQVVKSWTWLSDWTTTTTIFKSFTTIVNLCFTAFVKKTSFWIIKKSNLYAYKLIVFTFTASRWWALTTKQFSQAGGCWLLT